MKDKDTELRWKLTTKLEDLDFADDIALLSPTQQMMQRKTRKLQGQAARAGLRESNKKIQSYENKREKHGTSYCK